MGKINRIIWVVLDSVGIGEAKHTKDNQDGIDATLDYMKQDNQGIIYTNLVEFDSVWGHRNDYKGYAKGLEECESGNRKNLRQYCTDDSRYFGNAADSDWRKL